MIIRHLNKATRYATYHCVSLKIHTLDQGLNHVVGFADASVANNHELSTQLGHICSLADGHSRFVSITFRSTKYKLVVRSAMAGEVMSFSDLFDIAATLASDLGEIYSRPIPVQQLTDSKSLFDAISKVSRTSENRTMLNIAADREGFRNEVISDIGLIAALRISPMVWLSQCHKLLYKLLHLRECSRFTLSSGSFLIKSKLLFLSLTEASCNFLAKPLLLVLISLKA